MKKSIIAILMLIMIPALANADSNDSYYTKEKIKGYTKANFVVLSGDDVNFRTAAKTGSVLKVLTHHSLLRVLEYHQDWLKADSDGTVGYVYAPFTAQGKQEELIADDFIVNYAVFGERFNEKLATEKLGTLKDKLFEKKKKLINYVYDGIILGVDKRKNTLLSITVNSAKYITMRGISVGDNAGRLVGQYGIPHGVVYEADNVIYEYYWQCDKKKQMQFFVTVDKQSKIKTITLKALLK